MRFACATVLLLTACAPTAPTEAPTEAPADLARPDPPRVVTAPATPRADGVAVTLDREVYGPRDTVAVTFENRSQALAYVISDGCNAADGSPLPYVIVETLTDGAWGPPAIRHICATLYQAPRPLQPGDRETVRIAMGQRLPPGVYRYRFRTDLRAPSAPQRIDEPTSPPFRITG